jgi:transcription elongation factor
MNNIIFNGIHFSYEEKNIQIIDENEIVEIYSKILILKSNNNKFKPGDKIEQISICSTIHFEHEDGNPY